MFVWLSTRSRDGVINDEMNDKLLMGLGGLVIGLRVWCLAVQFDKGDFLRFRLNGDSWGFLFNYALWGKG